MNFLLQPWQLLVVTWTGRLNRQQQLLIDFLLAEVHVLKETHGGKRIPLSDDQRRHLAIKGRALGRKALQEIAIIVTPDTILRWHRQTVAAKWNSSNRRKTKPGRPPVFDDVTQLILRMARENPTWGYDHVQGALDNLGHRISETTVGNILKAHGIEPASDRKRQTTWKMFIKAHWEFLAAIDFTTVEVWTPLGQRRESRWSSDSIRIDQPCRSSVAVEPAPPSQVAACEPLCMWYNAHHPSCGSATWPLSSYTVLGQLIWPSL